jgi:arylsulfatase A-like enzyme
MPPYDAMFATPAELGDDENAIDLLRYEQEARHLDDEVRAFLDAVDGYGLSARTLLVVMADHGEEFHEHGQKHHGLQVYTETIHVPLMMRFPGAIPAGLRIATPVSLADLAPTILDFIGAPPIVGADGVSLVPLFTGGALPEWRRAVFSEAASALSALSIDLLSVQMPGIHCIYRTRNGTSECFDTARDPDERKPITGADARVDDVRVEAVKYWSLRRTPPPPTAASDLFRELRRDADDERLQKLRSLGYVE